MNLAANLSRLPKLTPLLGVMIVGALLLSVYVGAYVVRSREGRFEPAAIGLSGVKWYRWAPAGFVTDFKWDQAQMNFYYPLFLLDITFWHKADEMRDGKYPANIVQRE